LPGVPATKPIISSRFMPSGLPLRRVMMAASSSVGEARKAYLRVDGLVLAEEALRFL